MLDVVSKLILQNDKKTATDLTKMPNPWYIFKQKGISLFIEALCVPIGAPNI